MLCLCYQLVARLGVVAWYEINKEYVATVLCENKDKPAMKCCGKCYLQKQLTNTSDNTEKSPNKQLAKWENLNCAAVLPVYSLGVHNIQDVINTRIKGHYQNLYKFTHVVNIFHPPGLC